MALALLKRIENATTQPLEVKTEVDEQPILTAYTADIRPRGVLMTRHNGKAQSCIHCGYWEAQKDRPWWTGACAITGKGKTNKSHCDVPSYEEVLQ